MEVWLLSEGGNRLPPGVSCATHRIEGETPKSVHVREQAPAQTLFASGLWGVCAVAQSNSHRK